MSSERSAKPLTIVGAMRQGVVNEFARLGGIERGDAAGAA